MVGDRGDLCSAFSNALGPAAAMTLPGEADLEAALNDLLSRAREAYPAISVPAAAYVTYVAGRLDENKPVLQALQEIAAGDLLLAYSCVQGDGVAWRYLDAALRHTGASVLRSFRLSHSDQEEIVQGIRECLLLGRGGESPLLESFRGRGSVRSWLRVIVLRSAIRHTTVQQRTMHLDDAAISHLRMEHTDPELVFMKKHYLEKFTVALRKSLERLSNKNQSVLRHLLVNGLSVEEIAGVHEVAPRTVFRWIAETRTFLLKETRRQIVRDLELGDSDLESVMRLIQSRLQFPTSGDSAGG